MHSNSPDKGSTPKPRVCLYVFFPRGGIGRYSNELAMALRHVGCELEVVCTPDFDWADSEEYTVWPGLRSISNKFPPLRKFLFLLGQIVNPRRLIRHAKTTGANVIHLSNINHLSYPLWRNLLRTSGLSLVISVHDVKRQKGIVNHAFEAKQLAQIYRDADGLFVHSDYQKNELMAFSDCDGDKIMVVPHGPYPHGAAHGTKRSSRLEYRKKLGISDDVQVALFFGLVRDEKNLDGFLNAMAASEESFHLIVAGQVAARHKSIDAYKTQVADLGLSDHVTFITRYISDEDVHDLFEVADWVPLPYLNSFTSQSGVLNVATSFEKPILVSSSPVLKETVQMCDIGEICASSSPTDISDGITRLCKRVREADHFAFDDYHQRFSWEENARRTKSAYQNLAGRRECL